MELLDAPMERPLESSTQIDGVAVVRWPGRTSACRRSRAHARALACCSSRSMPSPRRRTDAARATGSASRSTSATCSRGSSCCGAGPASSGRSSATTVWCGAAPVWVALSPIEERLDRRVPRPPGPGALAAPARADRLARRDPEQPAPIDGRIKVLRPRIAPVGVRIHTVRGQGYLAEIQPIAVGADAA